MADDTGSNISKQPVAVASALRQRKKRKWDEPANFLISPGIAIPGSISMGIGSTLGISTPGVLPLSNAIATSTILPSIIPNAATLIQKLNQPKVQDELIAREIVINDAEPTIRYKLTKRQTQEEIQRSTGAVVITRGKYRPPNAFSDGEKPLYLHISAASHLKDMAERIIAVDRAAFMVEEILRQGYNSQTTPGPYTAFNSTGQVIQSLSTCVFLGFEPDPSQNIAARIRGPNDQYINHIINETGASVVLRGLGSGNHDISYTEETQQLHLHLSSASSKSLEAARSLAENLLDTISAECGASRVSSSKLYSAVPPPQQLLAGVQNSATIGTSVNPVVSSSCVISSIPQAAQSLASSSLVVSSVSTLSSLGALIQNGNSIPNTGFYVHPTANPGTCYSGYGGIYPQATPLQQVALALKSAPVSTTSVVASMTSHTNALPRMTSSSKADLDKRPPQKRKFQELPVTAKGLTAINQNSLQGSECFKPGLKDDADTRKFSSIPLPKKPTQFGEMPPPPPPPRMMPPPPPGMMPPPPPKFPSAQPHLDALSHSSKVIPSPPLHFPSSQPPLEANSQNLEALVEIPKSSTEPVSDTVLKLVEYEEEDEDDTSASAEESCRSNVVISTSSKPFWAL